MTNDDLEKSTAGLESFAEFVNQFSDDVYSRIVLEELFAAIYGKQIEETEEALPVLGEEGQEGDNGYPQLRLPSELSTDKINGFKEIKPPA